MAKELIFPRFPLFSQSGCGRNIYPCNSLLEGVSTCNYSDRPSVVGKGDAGIHVDGHELVYRFLAKALFLAYVRFQGTPPLPACFCTRFRTPPPSPARSYYTAFFFNKNSFYKNIQAENRQIFKKVLRIIVRLTLYFPCEIFSLGGFHGKSHFQQ